MSRLPALSDRVVVITGASSGIGRAAAVELAARGCRVALAARRLDSLEETARLCREAGGSALVVVTDVTQEAEVERLAELTLKEWGRIDVWVNNAGVTLFALLEQGPFEEHRRVIETNLYGAMHGARACVPIFRKQRQGILLNVGSILSKIGQPFVPSYVISKFAMRGMSESLRAALADEPDIHVCMLMPYAVDTPHFESGANELGHEARAMAPVQSPEKVARAIVDLIEHPRRERHLPRYAALGYALHWMFPRTTERLLLHMLQRWHLSDALEARTNGNLYNPPAQQGQAHGTRPPQIGTPGLATWAAFDLVRTQVQAMRRFITGKVARGAA